MTWRARVLISSAPNLVALGPLVDSYDTPAVVTSVDGDVLRANAAAREWLDGLWSEALAAFAEYVDANEEETEE